MADPIKVIGSEQACNTTPNTFNLASLVRVLNANTTAFTLITQKYANGTTKSTFSVGFAGSDGSVTYVIKDPTDTLQSNNNSDVRAVSVGFY
jgi:hypothetical protein